MKIKIFFTVLFTILLTTRVFAQWPGCFYALELKDSGGKTIDSLNKEYQFTIDMSNPYLLSIKLCGDSIKEIRTYILLIYSPSQKYQQAMKW